MTESLTLADAIFDPSSTTETGLVVSGSTHSYSASLNQVEKQSAELLALCLQFIGKQPSRIELLGIKKEWIEFEIEALRMKEKLEKEGTSEQKAAFNALIDKTKNIFFEILPAEPQHKSHSHGHCHGKKKGEHKYDHHHGHHGHHHGHHGHHHGYHGHHHGHHGHHHGHHGHHHGHHHPHNDHGTSFGPKKQYISDKFNFLKV